MEVQRQGQGEVQEAVRAVAQRVITAQGYELVGVEIKRQAGAQPLVRLFVDSEGGIGLDELQAVSNEVAAVLDAEDPIHSSYVLEVSSPGLDRPLRGENDYRRFCGRLAKLKSRDPVDGRRHWTGRLVGVEGATVVLRLEREGDLLARIPLDQIVQARLEVEFPRGTP